MSHVHDLPSDYSGPVPEPQRRARAEPPRQPPPRMPSDFLDPLSGEPGPLPVEPPTVDEEGEIVVIDDGPEATALSAGRMSTRLPYGQGYVKGPGAVKPSLAIRREGGDKPVSAERLFESRATITTEARERFLKSVERGLVDRRLEIANAWHSGGQRAVYAADSIDRHATVSALVKQGYLAFQSRPVSQPIPFR